jgi:hypothetical protein
MNPGTKALDTNPQLKGPIDIKPLLTCEQLIGESAPGIGSRLVDSELYISTTIGMSSIGMLLILRGCRPWSSCSC